jgi:hypothetical protein
MINKIILFVLNLFYGIIIINLMYQQLVHSLYCSDNILWIYYFILVIILYTLNIYNYLRTFDENKREKLFFKYLFSLIIIVFLLQKSDFSDLINEYIYYSLIIIPILLYKNTFYYIYNYNNNHNIIIILKNRLYSNLIALFLGTCAVMIYIMKLKFSNSVNIIPYDLLQLIILIMGIFMPQTIFSILLFDEIFNLKREDKRQLFLINYYVIMLIFLNRCYW